MRPIYDLNIYSLVDFDLRFERTDPIVMVFGLDSDLMRDKLGINKTFDFTTQSLYNALNTGTVETFTSANGNLSYRVNEASINKSDMLTVVYNYLLNELLFSANTPSYMQFAKNTLGLSDDVYGYVEKILPPLQNAEATYPGSGKALIFWVFFAADAVVGAMGSGGGDAMTIILSLISSGDTEKRNFAMSELRNDISNPGFSQILTSIIQPLISG